MASPPQEENQLSDKKDSDDAEGSSCQITSDKAETDSGYTDAASLPVSNKPETDPEYTDAASLPISRNVVEADCDASSSSSSCYMDASSGLQLKPQDSCEPPYVDARSAGSVFTDDQLVQDTSVHADLSRSSEQLQSSSDHPASDNVYFELEKMDDTGKDSETPDSRRKIQTLVKAEVNVAARARMFEGGNMNMHGSAGTKNGQCHDQDPIYSVPPCLQVAFEGEDASVKQSETDKKTTSKEESIYEITSSGEVNSQARPFESSVEGSGVYEVVGKPLTTMPSSSSSSVYQLAGPLGTTPQQPTSSGSRLSADSTGSGGLPGCKQGMPRMEQVQYVTPSQKEIESEYNRLHFGRNTKENTKSLPAEAGYDTLNQLWRSQTDAGTSQSLYESTETFHNNRSWGSEEWSDGSWGSSEFEDEDTEEGYLAEPDTPAPTKPLPRKPRHNGGADSLPQKIPGLLQKFITANARPRALEDSDAVCLPVTINTAKHPPPELPPAPEGLSDSQRKRRCVVELTISSEKSYIESLERIVQEYEKPILEAIPSSKSHVKAVLKETKEILNHHKMFQIELSDTVKRWDTEEKIGDIFTASFSKSMLVDAYSIYVNNFAAGMDEIRTVQHSRPSFEEFLKMKEKSSYDRLSIFGLMVKPVQRFPQFIMLLQDLIKYTPPSHHDRRALQLALTELESVAHKLNERKRLSEQYFQAKQTMQLLPRQLPSQVLSGRNMEKPRRLIRFDNFEQIDGEMENMKSSNRRLILMDDLLVCVKVGIKDQDGYMMERYRLKWAAKLSDVELKDTAITPDMRNVVKMDRNRLNAIASQLEKHVEDPFHLYADLRDMLHDLTVFGQITDSMKLLRRSYQGYNMSGELFNEVLSDLQRMIQIKDEQLRLVNSCSIILVDNSKTDKNHYVMQTPTASVKNEWCVDFNMAKLAIEKQNRPGWDRSPLAGNDDLEPAPALFMKCVPVDVPRNFTKVKCAIPIFMPSVPQASGLGVQHLWVCASNSSRGQVSIVSVHNTRPALTESFKACECEILFAEVVSGCGQKTDAAKFLFSGDTVWMSNTHNEIVIFPLSSSGEGSTATREPLAVVRVPGRVTNIKFVDERLFCGLDNGVVLVYSRNDVGEWCIKTARNLVLGRVPIKCQLVVDDNLWIACGHSVHVVEIDSLKILAVHTLSGNHESPILQMVHSGVGIWVAFHNSAAVRLFHLETMENLQEMSVANSINRVLAEKSGSSETRDCVVTCIASSTGLLWIGTSVGLILTLPLPRLSDGVPLYTGRPSVAYHGHRGPVRFIIPVYCSGSLLELHRNSSLRSKLRARPSLRNRKRELIELKGLTEDKLLSSGTELEASHSMHPQPARKKEDTADQSKTEESEIPEKMKDVAMKPRSGKRFWGLRRGKKDHGDDRSSSLKNYKRVSRPALRSKSRTLSFRSELANRIKHSSLGSFQAQSMIDLREDDGYEIEMLYENLLDVGDVSEEEEENFSEALDDLSIKSESAVLSSDVSSESRLQKARGSAVEPLDLAALNTEEGKSTAHQSVSPASSMSIVSEAGAEIKPKPRPRVVIPEPSSQLAGQPDDTPTPLASPRIATIRAHTMRKTSTSNAVMVLSGGDGYWDLNSGSSPSKNEDASLLFWIYKF